MATRADVRRIALSFPETEDAGDRFAFSVRLSAEPAKFFTEPHYDAKGGA